MESIERFKAYKASKKKPKKFSTIAKKYKPTGEKEVFKKVWDYRIHNCCICQQHIKEPSARCFAHLLAKSKRPQFRLNTDNIALCCDMICHMKVDSRTLGKRDKIEDMLKNGFIFDEIWLEVNTEQKE